MPNAEQYRYLLALGSNQRHHRIGRPRAVIAAAVEMIWNEGLRLVATAPIIESLPIGPSDRRFCNSCIVVETNLEPEDLLTLIKLVEAEFGRKRGGQPWRARVIDIDIILWNGGIWAGDRLTVPHPRFRERDFVLGPASAIAPNWRDPITGLTIRQQFACLTKPLTVTR